MKENVIFNDATKNQNPIKIFYDWYQEAKSSEINDPNAMSLATIDENGFPNVRIVLLKNFDERDGFIFYTNFHSKKGQEILSSMKAALCFHWKSLGRQVRVRGIIKIIEKSEADVYYYSRPRENRISALISKQSNPIKNRDILKNKFESCMKYYFSKKIPRPEYWSGFCVLPTDIEFWNNQPFRLHERILFKRENYKNNTWIGEFLYP